MQFWKNRFHVASSLQKHSIFDNIISLKSFRFKFVSVLIIKGRGRPSWFVLWQSFRRFSKLHSFFDASQIFTIYFSFETVLSFRFHVVQNAQIHHQSNSVAYILPLCLICAFRTNTCFSTVIEFEMYRSHNDFSAFEHRIVSFQDSISTTEKIFSTTNVL